MAAIAVLGFESGSGRHRQGYRRRHRVPGGTPSRNAEGCSSSVAGRVHPLHKRQALWPRQLRAARAAGKGIA